MVSDSDDSVIINKHPFSVRRSDFDQRDAFNYNSLDQYIYDEDSDKDSDEFDTGSKDSNENEELKIPEDMDNRKRTNGLIKRYDIDKIDDIENEVEVEEIISNNLKESLVLSNDSYKEDVDNTETTEEKITSELMSPVNNKKNSLDNASDEDIK